jgi:hypothetical protein
MNRFFILVQYCDVFIHRHIRVGSLFGAMFSSKHVLHIFLQYAQAKHFQFLIRHFGYKVRPPKSYTDLLLF